MIVRARELMGDIPSPELVQDCYKEFMSNSEDAAELRKAYENEVPILKRTRESGLPNQKLVHAFPRYIVTMSTGYLLGKPVEYQADSESDALEEIMNAYRKSDIPAVDAELAKDCGIYGHANELIYADENAMPKSVSICPENSFVVYDDTVQHRPLFGTYYVQRKIKGKTFYKITVLSKSTIATYNSESLTSAYSLEDEKPHFFQDVPLIQYRNNEDEQGDFEGVLSLINAYNVLESDRINDKDQFLDALLVIYGCNLQADESGRSPGRQLREDKLLYLPDKDCGAEYLTHVLDESQVEILKNSIKSDIHKFSMVPDLTDENFAQNSSGVAMSYKLLGFSNLTKIKERFFKESLRERMRLYANFLAVKATIPASFDADDVQITFNRSLPRNELEISTMVRNYMGIVPTEMLLTQVPFVDDAQAAIEKLDEEKEKEADMQAKLFERPDAMQNEEDDV